MDTSDDITTKLTCAEQAKINQKCKVECAAVANRSNTLSLLEVNADQNVKNPARNENEGVPGINEEDLRWTAASSPKNKLRGCKAKPSEGRGTL